MASALTSTRSTWRRAIPAISLPLPVGKKATEGGNAVFDTANPDAVYPAVGGSTTLIPIGKFLQSIDNTNGSASVSVQVQPNEEIWCRNWDSVTGSGAVTASNIGSEVYLASDHEVTTVSSGNSAAGRVWDVNGDGIWVQAPRPS